MGYPHPDVKKRRLKRLQKEQLDALNNSSNISKMDSKVDRHLSSTNYTFDETAKSYKTQEESKSLSNIDKCKETYGGAQSRPKDALKFKNREIAENTINYNDEQVHCKMNNSSPHCNSRNRHNEEEKNFRYLMFHIYRKQKNNHRY